MLLLISLVLNFFLASQVRTSHALGCDNKLHMQEDIAQAAKLIIQSTTQHHPLLSLDNALEAQYKLDNVLRQYKGVVYAERDLKLPPGELDKLQRQIRRQVEDVQSFILEEILRRQPRLSSDLQRLAGLEPARSSAR